MRSVKVERKPRNNPRAKTLRQAAARRPRAAQVQPGSAAGRDGAAAHGRLARLSARPCWC